MIISILLIEDSSEDVELIQAELQRANLEFSSDVVYDEPGFLDKLQTDAYDVIISDYGLPNWNGGRAMELLKQHGKQIPFILLTGSLGEELAVECMRMGMADYVLKGHLALLPAAVVRALDAQRLREGRQRAQSELRSAKQAAEAANHAQSEFLASIIHQIRTPMNAIIGMADLLAETPLNAEQMKYVNGFRQSGGNLLKLIDGLSDSAKIEAGKLEIEQI
jgi:signal transduction histidine kinase